MPNSLAFVIERAHRYGFAGAALDGVDIDASIAAATDPVLLTQAIDIAVRGREPLWVERLARRLRACGAGPGSHFELAAVLVANGQLDEARSEIAAMGVGASEGDARYRQVLGTLRAKEGRTEEAMAIFDTLSREKGEYQPLIAGIIAAQEMMGQGALAYAMTLLEQMDQKYAGHLHIRSLLLRCHLYSGDLETARELAQFPDMALAMASSYDRRAFVSAVAEIYELMGWTNELFDFMRDHIARDPTHWSLYSNAASAASATSRDADYAAIVAAILPASAGTAEALSILCRWHAEAYRTKEASAILDALRPLSATLFLGAFLYVKIKGGDQSEIDAAFETCRRCGIPLLGPALGYGLHVYYYNCTPDMLRAALARLTPFTASERVRPVFWQTYLRCLIGLGQRDKAEDYFRALPMGLTNGAMLKPFGMYFDQVRERHEKARDDWMTYIRATHHASVNARSSYPKTVHLKYSETPGAVLLFLTVFNGGDYIDWFLDHYRKLGVDHFFVTDNGSTDGTVSCLSMQPDVSLFSNSDSFARSGFGVLWTNHLMQRFGVGHWCFHVDMDEGFVFPGSDEGRTLKDLLAYCDERGFGLVRALALDMYPENLDMVGEADPFAASQYFDSDYFTVPSELPPYVIIQGGLRRRLTGLASYLQKSPLVRMGPDIRYLECNHGTTHVPVADVSGALLHYKFVSGLRRRVPESVTRGEHYGQSISYQLLDHSLGEAGWSGTLLSPYSQRYDGTASLLRLGLISSGAGWR